MRDKIQNTQGGSKMFKIQDTKGNDIARVKTLTLAKALIELDKMYNDQELVVINCETAEISFVS